jgi:hypothetical protein
MKRIVLCAAVCACVGAALGLHTGAWRSGVAASLLALLFWAYTELKAEAADPLEV